MSAKIPYTYISCPCTDNTKGSNTSYSQRPWGPGTAKQADDETDEEKTFDPKAPRSAYSLWPIEQLLYCEDCHQIRCPRCILEEITMWYCPSCYFEVPNSIVKSEGNRCQRNCYQCSICTSPLDINALDTDGNKLGGPYILGCPYCNWSSLDIGIQFDKPTNITGQLAKIRESDDAFTIRKKELIPTQQEPDESSGVEERVSEANEQFENLKSFYTTQIANSSPDPLLGFPNPSPSRLERMLSFYTNLANMGKPKQKKEKLPLMREAYGREEGLKVLGDEDDQIIEKMKNVGWEGTTSLEQRAEQPHEARFLSDIRPIPTLLHTKRSKRCRACRHILSKPEHKAQSIRYRIRLLATSYIPTISLLPFPPPPTATPQPPQTYLTATTLTPLKPTQYLLTVTNNLFAPITITLATQTHTPGRFPSKVTILCPSFEVAPNKDAWEEALDKPPDMGKGTGIRLGEGVDRSALAGVGGEGLARSISSVLGKKGLEQAEAGKVWAKGKNWTSVVVEIVPGSLDLRHRHRMLSRAGSEPSSPARGIGGGGGGPATGPAGDSRGDENVIEEDEEIVEVPVFVHMEYIDDEGDITRGPDEKKAEEVDGGVRRELAFWYVLGVGRIKRQG